MTKADTSARQARARFIIETISKEHGYLGDEVYARMDAKTRRQIQEALFKKNEMVGASIVALVKNMGDDQFIFELLKNANDSSFSRAKAIGVDPYVSFDIYKDRIIIECNEDGFKEADIRSICNIGQSSKAGGARGMGFKSVFRVAYKVHIQSGPYSFTFTHREEDLGMGMISPEWEETAHELPPPLTRTTLYLHETDSEDAQRRRISHHFRNVDFAILWSLKSLERVEIRFHNEDGNEASSLLRPMNQHGRVHAVDLERICTRDGDTTFTLPRFLWSVECDSNSEDEHPEQETPSTDHFSFNPSTPSDSTTTDTTISNIRRRRSTMKEYRALLSQVALQASRSRVFQRPNIDEDDEDDEDDGDSEDDEDLVASKIFNEMDLFHPDMTKTEREKRVEAAGHLYVFKLLHCSYSCFNHRHWTSTLRKYVTIHPAYNYMGSWTGIETSDFEFKDTSGELTAALVDQGHLQKKWLKRRPKYHIKVKTTSGPWDEPFYLESDAEYQKMRKLSTEQSVYIIFRVFNLYTGQIDCKMYVNPALLAEEGSLEFTVNRWMVRPRP
ncbi:hypothetical protein K449DRAFT_438428 [Hypoxylon sp. EC38]|nr:hypothetical protein K449DRAFT_438428 [Hypoxylon sp. EC38]